jgi:hypothetical protein
MRLWLLLFFCLPCLAATAAGTRRVVLDRKDFAEGERRDLLLDIDGSLRVSSQRATSLPLQANFVWCMERDARGRLWIGSGDGGVVFREEGGEYLSFADTPALEVHSLLVDGDRVLAGSSPDGVVYAIDEAGQVEVAADLPLQSIWALVSSQRGFFAAGGPAAQVAHVATGESTATVWAQLPAANALCLLRQGADLWIGTESPGLVLRAPDEDASRLRTLFAAAEAEIRALISDGADGVFVLSLELLGADDGKSTSRITHLTRDGADETIYVGEERLLDLARMADGTLLAADAHARAILRMDSQGRSAVWYSLEQADPIRLRVEGDGRVLVGTGNLASILQLRAGEVARGQFTSKPIPTPFAAQYGRIDAWPADRSIQFELRSGVSPQPDLSWSEWSKPSALGAQTELPAAAHCQIRLNLPRDAAPLAEVVLSYRERNLAPRLSDVQIEPAGAPIQLGSAGSSPGQISQTFEDGLSIEFSVQAPPAAAAPELANWARGVRVLKWKSEDANGDKLSHRIEIARQPDGAWSLVRAAQELSPFALDTRLWPDGSYRLRIVASDELSNGPEEARSAQALSALLHIDNTPPRIEDGKCERGRLQARLIDDASPLVHLAWQIGEGVWQPLDAVDRILDAREERLDVATPAVFAPTRLRLRLTDAPGNVRLAEFELVPTSRSQ